jgi:site-specific DNA recombinase
MTSTFVEHGVQVWLPELDGPVDPENSVHQAVVLQLGARSRREVVRARFRTTAAMRTQARDQGRYLGGRTPYGCRLVDAGPHPNQAHACWGRRLQRLDPDPRTAQTVGWIFAERRAGRSVSGIARALNEAGVPCPSAADAERNPHCDGRRWTETSSGAAPAARPWTSSLASTAATRSVSA